MTDYLKNHHSLKDAISLFETELKSESPNTLILCRLYIIILWSSFLFPISSKGMYLIFSIKLDKLSASKYILWSMEVYEFLI